MRDVMRKYVEAGLGALSTERAEELARDMLEWSRRNGERLMGLIRREVQRQMKLMGVATRDELSALKKRVRTLERQAAQPKRAARKASAKKSSAKKSSAKRAGRRAGE